MIIIVVMIFVIMIPTILCRTLRKQKLPHRRKRPLSWLGQVHSSKSLESGFMQLLLLHCALHIQSLASHVVSQGIANNVSTG